MKRNFLSADAVHPTYPYPSCVSRNNVFTFHDFHPAQVVSAWCALPVWFCPHCFLIVNHDGTMRVQETLAGENTGEYLQFSESLVNLLPDEYKKRT